MYIFGHWVCCIIITKVNTATEVQRFAKHHSNKNRLKSHKYLTNNQFNKRYINRKNTFTQERFAIKKQRFAIKNREGFAIKNNIKLCQVARRIVPLHHR